MFTVSTTYKLLHGLALAMLSVPGHVVGLQQALSQRYCHFLPFTLAKARPHNVLHFPSIIRVTIHIIICKQRGLVVVPKVINNQLTIASRKQRPI